MDDDDDGIVSAFFVGVSFVLFVSLLSCSFSFSFAFSFSWGAISITLTFDCGALIV